ncbi:MAG: hypothetical protein GWM87_11055 [Xanthomonadales bacterium]|nr:hypothetical protein [Xanthomonadales bacterium]NIX13415.1 hypothetical protein [Xanthomonadales bacterium]
MNDAIDKLAERPPRRFAWLALAMVLVPVAYLALLLTGGGAGGFEAWDNLLILLVLVIASAVTGLAFAALSIRRDEQSAMAYFAMLMHLTLGLLAGWALLQ